MNLKDYIRNVPNFPIQGINFKDITTLLEDSSAFNYSVDQMINKTKLYEFDKIAVIESRGFIFGSTLSYLTKKPLILIRKTNKLPAAKVSIEYDLEYGSSVIEIHKNSISSGDKVIIVDDLIATGGSALTAVNLVKKMGGKTSGLIFLIDLVSLGGSKLLENEGFSCSSLIDYD